MGPIIRIGAFHHIEIPCPDLELAERFYGSVLGGSVYMRRDARRRSGVPATGTIEDARERGFEIDATYMKIGEDFRIGFLKGDSNQGRREIDHLAFTIHEDDVASLAGRLEEGGIQVVERFPDHLLISDPFGMVLELWPRRVLTGMGLL